MNGYSLTARDIECKVSATKNKNDMHVEFLWAKPFKNQRKKKKKNVR